MILLLAAAHAVTFTGPAYLHGLQGFGTEIAPAGDVNVDGYADLLVSREGDQWGFFVYLGGPTGPVRGSTHGGGLAGPAVARIAGALAGGEDIDGDGYPDVVAGFRSRRLGVGCLRLWLGGPSGLAAHAHQEICDTSGAGLGHRVASPGDITGDGWADVVTLGSDGVLYVYAGGAGGLGARPLAQFTAPADPSLVGAHGLAGAGDVNGDGYADVVLGYEDGAGGAAFTVYHGGADGLTDERAEVVEGVLYWEFGISVASAGDVDGDGYDDVLAGDPSAQGWYGAAVLVPGSADGLDEANARVLGGYTGTPEYQQFAYALGGGSDFDGDGASDLVFTAPGHWNDGGRVEGEWGGAYVLASGDALKPSDFYGAEHYWHAPFLPGKFDAGADLALPGDLDGDGCDDLVLSEYWRPGDFRGPAFRLAVWYGGC